MQVHQIATIPVASTPAGLARSIKFGGIPAGQVLALAIEGDGQDLPAFTAYAGQDGQPQAEDIVDTVVKSPSGAYGLSYAAAIKADGGSLIVLFKGDAALAKVPDKLVDAAKIARAAFTDNGTVVQAPKDYHTALFPASPAESEAMFVAKGETVVTLQKPTAAFQLGVARISAHGNVEAQILLAGIGEKDLFAASESNVAACDGKGFDPKWASVFRFKWPIGTIAREDDANKVVVQLADGTFWKVTAVKRGFNVEKIDAEFQDDVMPEGYKYLGVTSAFGTGNSHALFVRPPQAAVKGQPRQTQLRFVPTSRLPAALVASV